MRKRSGFSLVEVLIAGMILSGAVLTLGAISTNALSDARLNRHYETAAMLADRQLTLIDYLGIDQFVQSGQTEGVFEEYEPGYQWQVSTEYQGTDDLYQVSITMHWAEGKRPYRITVQTMLNGTNTTLGTGTGTEPGTETGTETGAAATPGEQSGESNSR
jgi:type II secretory pathway pseudopilin PulG